jgi:hypothetical protein
MTTPLAVLVLSGWGDALFILPVALLVFEPVLVLLAVGHVLLTGVRGIEILRTSHVQSSEQFAPVVCPCGIMARRYRGRHQPAERKLPMSDSEELARKERHRRLIERLNETEKLIGPQSAARGEQMSEEELAAEIEKQRTLNAARRGGFSF